MSTRRSPDTGHAGERTPRRTRHRYAPRTLSSALTSFTGELAPATTLARVQACWEQAAGATVASACRPTAERDGVLTVTCSEAVWAHELQMMGPQVLERLNSLLGGESLTRLRCRTG